MPPKEPHYLLQFFSFKHLTNEKAKEVSKSFHDLAHSIEDTVPDNQEKTMALRKLLEAKDCAVRATFMK